MRASPSIGWTALLGFSFAGFFDGILLHQILQWHHLLSGLGGDLRFQVLWDGLFHALMYVLAGLALWKLWRERGAAPDLSAARVIGAALLGFGLWHLLDAVLSHWMLAVHRIRMDSARPLAWDLAWLALFGAVPLAAAWFLLRGPATPARGAARWMILLAALTAGAGGWALLGPKEPGLAAVVFPRAASEQQMMAAIAAAGARLAWSDLEARVVVIQAPRRGRWSLYQKGALLVGGAGLPAGCFRWSR